MRTQRAVFAAVVLLALLSPLAAQDRLGRIVAIDGYAQIDAFGTGRFIDAEPGDVLYESTVLRTEYESWVRVVVGSHSFEIAPSSTTRVATFASDRRGERGVLGRLIRGIFNSLAPPEDDVADFGGRAAEVQSPGSMGSLFVVDVEPDEEFAAGQEALEDGAFREAVDHFRRIEYPEDGTFSLTEYYVSLSYALLGLGDMDAAVRAAFEYALEEPSPAAVESLPPRLKLLVTIGSFYAGDDDLAKSACAAYLEEIGLAAADPQAIAIRVRLLEESDPEQARELEASARRAQPGADWDGLLGG